MVECLETAGRSTTKTMGRAFRHLLGAILVSANYGQSDELREVQVLMELERCFMWEMSEEESIPRVSSRNLG